MKARANIDALIPRYKSGSEQYSEWEAKEA